MNRWQLFATLYLSIGAMGLVWGWSQPGVFEMVRPQYEKLPPVGRWAWWIAAILAGLLSWPIRIATILNPQGAWREKLLSRFRRGYLDRDDLLKPQMPARLCEQHRRPLRCAHVDCTKCGQVIHWPVCDECPQPIAGAPWVCGRCFRREGR
jgi:hypothetical protein